LKQELVCANNQSNQTIFELEKQIIQLSSKYNEANTRIELLQQNLTQE